MNVRPNHTYNVSVVTCTNRPQFFKHLVANYRRQLYRGKELIIVLNRDGMNLAAYRRKVRAYPDISVYKLKETTSLGRCLNFAVRRAKYPYIAKFDDDDYYSPYYLIEQMAAIRRTGADIVGKRNHLIFFEGRNLLIQRFPGRRNRFVSLVTGGSILFRKRVFRRVRFENRSLGEDVSFLWKCRRRGFRIYSTSIYNFVGIRRENKNSHTWTAHDGYLLKGSRIVAKTANYRRIADRPVHA